MARERTSSDGGLRLLTLNFRVSECEKARIVEAATAEGSRYGTWLRALALEKCDLLDKATNRAKRSNKTEKRKGKIAKDMA